MMSGFNGQLLCSVQVFTGSVKEGVRRGMMGPVNEVMTEENCWPVR